MIKWLMLFKKTAVYTESHPTQIYYKKCRVADY